MRWFLDFPLQRKLTLLIASTAGVALLLTCLAFLAFEYFDMKNGTAASVNTVAEVIAHHSTAALSFHDEGAAVETLASLQSYSRVAEAAIFGPKGEALGPTAGTRAPTRLRCRFIRLASITKVVR